MNHFLNPEQLKESVRKKYREVAEGNELQHDEEILGRSSPLEFVTIKKGDTVVDLGSGTGTDCFKAYSAAGETGLVIGIDFTEKMIEKASANAAKLNYTNVEFRKGDIESIPINNDTVDVVISNNSLNLVPDTTKAFSEIYRILKTGGYFCICDTVMIGELPDQLRIKKETAVGCIAGIKEIDLYIGVIIETGFVNLKILNGKRISSGDAVPGQQMITEGRLHTNINPGGIFRVTLYAEK